MFVFSKTICKLYKAMNRAGEAEVYNKTGSEEIEKGIFLSKMYSNIYCIDTTK